MYFYVDRIVTEILEFIGHTCTLKRRYAAEYAMSSSVEPVIYAMPEKEEMVEKASKLIVVSEKKKSPSLLPNYGLGLGAQG